MPWPCARVLQALCVLAVVQIALAQTPNPGNVPTASSSKTPTKPAPDPPPLPPDVVGADPPTNTTQSGHAVTRTLKRLAPNCINGIFHACWSSPPQKRQPPQTDERKGTESREVAEFYLERGNYRAAESRFREALQYNPNDSKAVFELAQCLENLKHVDEAIAEYQVCIDEQSPNPYAERARNAVQRLEESSKVASPPH